MSKLTLKKATREDAEALTAISTRAFATDIDVGGDGIGGPTGYDSVPWHRMMIGRGFVHCAWLDGALVGCAILFPDEHEKGALNIGRICIDPAYFRRGLGLEMMRLIERAFPDVRAWTLDTPVWNTRTNAFYRKLGYAEVAREDDMVFYRKANPAHGADA